MEPINRPEPVLSGETDVDTAIANAQAAYDSIDGELIV